MKKKITFYLFAFLILSRAMAQGGFFQVEFPASTCVNCHTVPLGTGDRVAQCATAPGGIHNIFCSWPIGSMYRRIELPILANPYGAIGYTVNDMKAVGNKLFMCGTMQTPLGSGSAFPDGYAEEGFMAILNLDDVFDAYGTSPRFRYSKIGGTADLRRLAVSVNGSDTAIFAIGKNSDGSPVFVAVNDYNAWNCNVQTFDSPTETFTDIVVCGKFVAVASRFANENYTFGLRLAGLQMLASREGFADLAQVHKFITLGMHTAGFSDHPTRHADDATIRIAVQADDELTVAYEGYNAILQQDQFIPAMAKVMALFRIDAGSVYNPIMTDARDFDVPYHNGELFEDMQAVPATGEYALLHRDRASVLGGGGVAVFSWNTTSLQVISRPASSMESFGVSGTRLWYGGNRQESGVLYCGVHPLGLPDESQCLQSLTRNCHPLDEPCSKITLETISSLDDVIFGWDRVNLEPMQVQKDIVCE